jgi:hypothetical protein
LKCHAIAITVASQQPQQLLLRRHLWNSCVPTQVWYPNNLEKPDPVNTIEKVRSCFIVV